MKVRCSLLFLSVLENSFDEQNYKHLKSCIMKKRQIKNLSLSKKTVSTFSYGKVSGGSFFSEGPSCYCKSAAANHLSIGNCEPCHIL